MHKCQTGAAFPITPQLNYLCSSKQTASLVLSNSNFVSSLTHAKLSENYSRMFADVQWYTSIIFHSAWINWRVIQENYCVELVAGKTESKQQAKKIQLESLWQCRTVKQSCSFTLSHPTASSVLSDFNLVSNLKLSENYCRMLADVQWYTCILFLFA